MGADARVPRPDSFSFPLLGDLHLDHLEDHDHAWLKANKPDDVHQVENYSRITREVHPKLFAAVREKVTALNQEASTRVPFVIQVGDLVEGLAGTDELAQQQCRAGVDLVRGANLGAPLLLTKGNHDVTGPGAVPAFNDVLLPFVKNEAGHLKSGEWEGANFAMEYGNAFFAFFDAYDAVKSLAWLEATLAKRTATHCFVVIHPPVVPYGARATWHIFSSDKQKAQRAHLLDLLGAQHAYVLGGHIHRFNSLVRETPKGRFLQLAISSIVSSPETKARDVLSGTGDYTPDQIKVEPNFGKNNEAERRAALQAEAPLVKDFEYADVPGYAVITVTNSRVEAGIHPGTSRQAWKTLDLSARLHG
jgi:hypothetical protein